MKGGSVDLKNKKHIYRKLFTSTFYLSAFTFGGGFVIIPLMKKKFVDDLQWIKEDEMLNLAAIAQSSPGAVAVNAAILLGYRVAGILGALVTILGTILPPIITLTIISFFYAAFRDNIVVNSVLKGMQAGIAAVIADVVLNLGDNVLKEKDIVFAIIMVGAFVATFFLGINVIYIILVCGFIGAAKMLLQIRKIQKEGDSQ
ncbi:chromate transporter [Herbinix luporum]|jgi:chromate transporter|uniref:chromate transporter n=1 Tax=Herbinix luporum TaxID=1679721 RepID=UPI00071DD41A|nr:chromate transporter [Herbinix luporum]